MKKKLYPLSVGQTVRIKRARHKQFIGKIGKIERVEKSFKDVTSNLVTDESAIKNICLPYEFDGETLTIHHPETDYGSWIQKAYTRVAKFYGYSYSIRLEGYDYLIGVSHKQVESI